MNVVNDKKSEGEVGKLLDDIEYIRSIDRGNLYTLIERMPEQMEHAAASCPKQIFINRDRKFSAIGVVGVGTTRVCGELLKSFSDLEGTIPVIPINDYSLPNWAGRTTLLFFVSFSGNTEEVMSCFEQSRMRGCPAVVITSGGRLERDAVQNNVPVVKIRKEKPQNRTVLPYMIVPLLLIGAQIGVVPFKQEDFLQTVRFLKIQRESLDAHQKTENNRAKKIALHFYDSIPLVYTDGALYRGVVLRWQYQFNENAKVLAYSSWLPEMSHNEIVGLYGNHKQAHAACVFLSGEGRRNESNKRFDFTCSAIKEKGYSFLHVPLAGDDELQRVFYGIYLGDLVSLYLAILRGVDPQSVGLIDRIRLKDQPGFKSLER